MRTTLGLMLAISLSIACGGDDDTPDMGADTAIDTTSRIDMGCTGECDPCGGRVPPTCVDPATCIDSGRSAVCNELIGVNGEFECPAGTLDATMCPPPSATCSSPDQCQVIANTCCGVCGAPTIDDVFGVHLSQVEDTRSRLCTGAPICPDCPSEPNPQLMATCREMECMALDLNATGLTVCAEDADCRVRAPECCECGGTTDPNSLVALNTSSESDYSDLACPAEASCDECAPVYPDTVEAFCNEGICAVRPTSE